MLPDVESRTWRLSWIYAVLNPKDTRKELVSRREVNTGNGMDNGLNDMNGLAAGLQRS